MSGRGITFDVMRERWEGINMKSQDRMAVLAARIRDLLGKTKMSQKELAQRAEVTEKHISEIVNAKASPSVDLLENIAEAFGITLAEFWIDTDPERGVSDGQRVSLVKGKIFPIPLYSKASEVCAGGGNVLPQPEIEMPFYVHEDWVGGPLGPKQVYSIRMEGDSMEPKIPAGSIVVVNPNAEVRSGDVALVCIDDRMMIKQLFFRGNGVELNPINPAYKAATFTHEELDGLAFSIQGKVPYYTRGGPVNGLD